MFNSSFTTMKRNMASGQGIMYSIFSGGKLKQNDVTAITNYANAMKGGANSAQAWSTGMNGASVAAKKYVLNARKAGKSTDEMVDGLKKLPKTTTAASIGFKALSVAANIALSIGITMAISAVIKGFQALANTQENAIAKADEFISKFNEQRTSLTENKKAIDSMSEDYEKLANGVDALGRNVSLNSDEYARYNEIVNQIADMFPHMVQGYTDEGNAIIAHKGNIEELTKAYEEQKKAAQDAIIVGSADVFKGFKAKVDKDANISWEETGLIQLKSLGGYLTSIINDQEKVEEFLSNLSNSSYDYNYVQLKDLLTNAGYTVSWNNDYDKALEDVKADPQKLHSYLSTINSTIEAEVVKIKPIMQAYLEQSYDYQGLDEDVQDIVKQIVGQFDSEFYAQFDSETEMASWVTENIVNKFKGKDGEKMSTEFQMMLGIQTQFNKGEITVGEYQEKLSAFLKTIEPLPDETEKYIKLLFGISTDSDGKTSSDVDTMVANVKKKFNGKFEDKIGGLELSELEILANMDISPEGIEDWSEVEVLIANARKEANKMTASLSDFEKASDNIKPLSTAFKELSDDGYITIKTLKEVKDAADLSSEEWAEYEGKLLKAKVGSSEFNQIMSDLTYKILDNTFAGKDLNNLTEQQIAATLRENGVVNASAVAHDWLAKAKAKEKISSMELVKGSKLNIEALTLVASACSVTKNAYLELVAKEILFNRNDLDIEDKVKKLNQIAVAAGVAGINIDNLNSKFSSQDDKNKYVEESGGVVKVSALASKVKGSMPPIAVGRQSPFVLTRLKDFVNEFEYELPDGTKTKDFNEYYLTNEMNKLAERIAGAVTGFTIPNFTDPTDKNEALDNYLKDAENRYKIHQDETAYIKELQYAYDTLTKSDKERLDITGKINEAYRDLADNRIKDIEHQIDLAKELNEYADVTDYYKQIQEIAQEEANRYREFAKKELGYYDEDTTDEQRAKIEADIEKTNEIQDLQKKWWDAQNKIADESYSNSERWISERNTYNDWDLYGDNEIAAWERVLKRFKTEFPNELEKIKDIEQKIFELRKEEMEKSIDDIEDYINARNTYNDWDAYGDSEVKAIQRQTKIIEDAYRDRLLSYEEYVDRLEEQSQKLYSLGQDRVDKHLSNIDKYIDARNHYDDWDAFGDSEISAIKRQLKILDEAYKLNLISLEEYTEKTEEYTQRLYSAAKNNIVETVSELIEDYEEMKQFELSQLESQKTLLQSYYDVVNAIADAQHEIRKELEASMSMCEYLNEDTRELLFNQEDYNALSEELLNIQTEADELKKQYQEDILNADAETIAEITEQYQMQYETIMKKYEIAKAELEVAKKRQKLDNVLAERNTRMFINGQWQWVAKTQDVINAQNELADAEIEKKKQEASLEQTEAINDFTAQINSLETDLNKVRKWWSDMQEMLDDESDEVAKALKEISKVSSPELKRVIEATGGSVDSFSALLSESTTAMSTVINTDIDSMSTGIGTVITDLENYSKAIQELTAKINGTKTDENNNNQRSTSDIIAEMKENSEKWHTASDSEKERLALRNQELGDSIEADYDPATGKWYSSDGKLLYSVSSSINGSNSSSKVTSSYSGKTVQAGSDGNAPAGTKVGDTVKTSGGDYLVVAPNTKGANYNPASGLWSIKIDEKDADGTRYTSGGMTLMGEEGFEAFISNTGRLIPITRPVIGNIGAGGIVFNREQMASLRNLWDWSNIGKISPLVSSSNTGGQNTVIDNSIHINGLTVSEQGNEDWINGLRRYVATHK